MFTKLNIVEAIVVCPCIDGIDWIKQKREKD